MMFFKTILPQKSPFLAKKTAFCLAFFDQKVKMTKSEKAQIQWQA